MRTATDREAWQAIARRHRRWRGIVLVHRFRVWFAKVLRRTVTRLDP